jgi:hypothetical protein
VVTSKETQEKILRVIKKHYARLVMSVTGSKVLTESEKEDIRELGVDPDQSTDGLMALAYHHNFINNPVDENSPRSVEEMREQQGRPGAKPRGEAHDYSVETINDQTKQYIDKLRMDNSTRILGIIRQNNDNYKFEALQNLDRPDLSDQLVKEASLGKVKQQLRDTSKEANRDWQRVALTEMSNAIGVGSVDRIVSNNADKNAEEVYVYRVIVGDSLTCKFCRRFYGDVGQPPKVYRLSTLLGNGSNYGKKQDMWKPVVGATHPNTRTSQILELKPGFKVLPGGRVTFIGRENWNSYINEVLEG